MAMSRAGCPPPWGPLLPKTGHLISTSLRPKLWKGLALGDTHGGDTKGQDSKPLALQGFCWVQAQLPTTPSWMREQPLPWGCAHPSCTGVVDATSTAGGLRANGDTGWHGKGFAQIDATPVQLGIGEQSPSLQHRVRP